jgi:ubiquinone/menaquinone biosynthesis C-methylase UbiE
MPMTEETLVRNYERPADADVNNVTYQRCLYAYEFAREYIHGKTVLDVGCGNGYGTALMSQDALSITGVDYDQPTVDANRTRYKTIPNIAFLQAKTPPLPTSDNSIDVITAFQFIEHLEDRPAFLRDAYRVLKPNGVLLLTTPNVKRSLARNPFHVHEYTFDEFAAELSAIFPTVELFGLSGNEKVEDYYAKNAAFVRSVLRWDVLGLHKILPASILIKPYNAITHFMRQRLRDNAPQTTTISVKDFFTTNKNLDDTLDIYAVAKKV